jgi:zinc/manganese transport system substrate-binding protein
MRMYLCNSQTDVLVLRLSLRICFGRMQTTAPITRSGRYLRGHSGVAAVAALILAALVVSACGSSSAAPVSTSTSGVINAIGAENEYADVLGQIGGKYVNVSSILNNPNTDPHTYESSPSVAQEVSAAQLIVQNGVGYDTFMNRIESASPSSSRKVIIVQHVLGLPTNTPNPHLWYDPRTMPAVAAVMETDLSTLQPSHASYFQANLAKFNTSLQPWLAAIASFKAQYAGTAAATTEPVADYLLTAMGIHNLTPFAFQADIMNGVDPTPQDITLENGFFTQHQVKVFCYNQQVVSNLTASVRQNAQQNNVPIVGVYETMPTPGYDYQTWMLAEVNAIEKAITSGTSTEHL